MNNVVELNKKVLTLLMSAKEKIITPDAWIQGTFARNIRGESVGYLCSAVYYDMAGALLSFKNKENKNSINLALKFLYNQIRSINSEAASIAEFNDNHDTNHDLVLKVYDLAIEEAKHWGI